MTTADPMDVDPRPSENGDGTGSVEAEAKVSSNDTGTNCREALHLDPLPLPKEDPSLGTGESHILDIGIDSGNQSSPKGLAANDEHAEHPMPEQDIMDASSPRSSASMQDEIVVAPRRNVLPENDIQPGDDKSEAQFVPVTPTKLPSSDKDGAKKTHDTPTTQAKFELKDDEATTPAARRNPKRSASAMAQLQIMKESDHEDILDETLRPLEAEEREEWVGWIELESEPAFFNFILRDLGAEDVLIKEVLCLDDELIRLIPKPIHGLIFLFQYQPENWEVDEESDTDDVWFANQTVDNACATIAMMNILMNAPNVELGETLKEFKETTRTMSSPLRGHALSTNKFIRKVHNSFTRRLDHLNADLCLSSKAETASKRTKRAKGKKSKGKKIDDSGYHFIAYVPVNGHVWELDGLKARPTKLEPVTSEDWALNALPTIWSRMEDYGGGFEFNLLAMCQSPLRDLCHEIAANARVLGVIRRSLEGLPGSAPGGDGEKSELPNPEKFPEYRVTPEMVTAAPVPGHMSPLLSLLGAIPSADEPEGSPVPTSDHSGTLSVPRDTFLNFLYYALGTEPELHPAENITLTPADVRTHLETLAAKTSVEQDDAIARHVLEMGALATDLERVEGRKRDYTPAIHAWMKILADKGVLEQIAG